MNIFICNFRNQFPRQDESQRFAAKKYTRIDLWDIA